MCTGMFTTNNKQILLQWTAVDQKNEQEKYLMGLTERHEVSRHVSLKMTRSTNVIKYKYFLNYYKENYAYRFGRPQIEVCSKWEDLNAEIKCTSLNDSAKRTAVAELLIRKRRACKVYKQLKRLKTVSYTHLDVYKRQYICVHTHSLFWLIGYLGQPLYWNNIQNTISQQGYT